MAEAQASASYVRRTRHAGAIVRQDLNELIRSVELQITSQENGYGVLGGAVRDGDAEFLGYRYPETLVFRVTGHARRMRQGIFSGGPLLADGAV